jgi:LPS export ABC transporter permease LptG/LPS export ABC transporter permease LptF
VRIRGFRLDRYVISEILGPLGLGFLVYTFILLLRFLFDSAEMIIRRGLPVSIVGELLMLTLPNIVVLTLPMSLLFGILIAVGRLSSDSELVAMRSSGLSLLKLYRPILFLSAVFTVLNIWLMVYALPWGNHALQQLRLEITTQSISQQVQPRVFYEEWEGKVLYVFETPEGEERWKGVFLAESVPSGEDNEITIADWGEVRVEPDGERVVLRLYNAIRHKVNLNAPDRYEVSRHRRLDLILEERFTSEQKAKISVSKGIRELTLEELADLKDDPTASQEQRNLAYVEIHKKFSIPAACLVFGLLGLALGVTARRDGRLAGFAIGLGVVFVYYIVMYLAEGLTKGHLMPAVLARWMPNLVLAPVAVGALIWRARWAEGRFPIPSIRLPRFARWRRTESPAPAPRSAAPVAGGRDRIVLVVRFPRFWYPRLTILDRYISTLAIRIMALAFAGLLGLFYIATFVDLSDKLFKGQATPGMLLEYFWFASPQFIYFVIPLSILVASLVVVGILARTSELTVMKACGISLYRAAAPLLLVAMVASATLFLLEENLLARANRRAEALNDEIRGRAPRTFNLLTRRWLAGREGALYHYAFFDAERDELSQLSVYEFAPDAWRLARHTFTGRASYRPRQGGWVGQDGWVATFPRADTPPTWERFERRLIAIEPPEHFETERPDERFMTASELRTFVSELRASGLNAVPMEVALARKIAFPFVTVVMTLIAIPFAATTGRSGAVYGIGLGIALAIGYWMLMSAFGAVGSAGLLPPMLAAWGPNLLFGGGAVYLLLVVRT